MIQYRIREVVAKGGERMPVLVDDSGVPLFEPMLYVLTVGRARNQAYNTLANTLRSLSLFLNFLQHKNIELKQRIAVGDLFDINEIQELVVFTRIFFRQIDAFATSAVLGVNDRSSLKLESIRGRSAGNSAKEVVSSFAATRIRYIRDFVSWFVRYQSTFLKSNRKIIDRLERNLSIFINLINARIPTTDRRGILDGRQGLSKEVIEKIMKIIDPLSSENPWSNEHCRYRNYLLFLWLIHLGLRRGEVLGVKISDIDFRSGEVVIVRRADDPDDVRNNPPNAKTRARKIPLSDDLLALTSQYVMSYRSNISGAQANNFLFVANGGGLPMSMSSFAKIFRVLRASSCGLTEILFAHLFRHTWNDRFSEEMDKNGIGEAQEQKLRSYLMGWSETSDSAITYTKRHIQKKAKEASLSMQTDIWDHKK